MAKRILVPLNRGDRAEAVVPVVGDIARASGGTVRMLYVAPVPEEVRGEYGRVIAYVDQEMARIEGEAVDGLTSARALLHDVPVEVVVRFGDVGEEILRETEAFGADLVALTADGGGRLRWALGGGIAGRVFREAGVPVLLLREPPAAAPAA